MRRAGLVLLLCTLLLTGCRQSSATESEPPIPTVAQELISTEPTMDLPVLEPWQRAYIGLLQEDIRENREQAREEETGSSSIEENYCIYDVDKDGIPELFIRYWEAGRFYYDVYTCPEEEPLFAGNFYGGRVSAHLYSCLGENGVLSEAVRADPYGETHWWRSFTLADGDLEETELLDEVLRWEEEFSPAKPEDFVPGAQILNLTGLADNDRSPILNYPGQKRAAELYAQYLGDNLPAWRDGRPFYFCEYPQDPSALADGVLIVRDLTGDGIPELCYQGDISSLTICTVKEDRVESLSVPGNGWKALLPNGGILSHRWDVDLQGDVYAYSWLSPESRELPEMVFSSGDSDRDGEKDWFSINDTKVSQTEWEERTAPYRALRDEESSEEILFQDWAATLNVAVLPAPDPTMTLEEAAILYARFLQDDVAIYFDTWRETCYHSNFYYGLNMERTLDMYLVKDLTGDGIPELYNNNPGPTNFIWSVKDGRVITIGGTDTYTKIAPNGGYFYHRPGGAPTHDRYWYEWLSPESKSLPEAGFSDWHPHDEPDSYEFNGEEVTKEEWEALTAPYFALYEQKGEREESLYFRDWASNLGVELPQPEMDEAKAFRVYTNELRMPLERDEIEYYNLRVWDFDGDGLPEIYDVTEPFRVYGIVGLHMEELGTLADFDGIPKEEVTFSAWQEELLADPVSGKEGS